MSVIFVDTETTGLEPDSHVLQLAAKCGQREFNAYMLPRRPISYGATQVHGITQHGNSLFVYNKEVRPQHPGVVMQQFAAFVRGCNSDSSVLVSHKANFDAPRILKLATYYGVYNDLYDSTYGYADSISVFKNVVRGLPAYNLPYLVQTYLQHDNHTLHNALGDVRALHELAEELDIDDDDFFQEAESFDNFY